MQRPKDDVELRQVEKENLEPIPQEAEAVTSLAPLDLVPDESLRSNGPTEEQDWAARMIQYAYRCHVWHR
ncbi:hypothetical protein BDR05DRAFT_968520 [Suillus weaverae]|nr:hypothetical protein BDR05DRAFT_968520 [Suillus weaverae]